MIAGCTQEQRLQGTVAGYKACLEKVSKQGLQPSAQRVHCLAKHESSIPVTLGGTARYHSNFANEVIDFRGNVENKSTDYVVTKFTVILRLKDKDITQITDVNVHLEPGQKGEFYVSDLEYTPNDDETKKDKFEWGMDNVRGLKVSTD
jgi:hypothetical protein